MRLRSFVLIFLLVLQTSFTLAAEPQAQPKRDMVAWYRQPGQKWLDAMPMGNGMIGAMVFGGIQQERIALNESTFWSGRPHDYDDPDALKYFPQIRDLVFAGKFQEAEKMADEHFYGKPVAQQAFQPLGDLLLSFDGLDNTADYRCELDMETGVVKITFRSGDAILTREVFVSYPIMKGSAQFLLELLVEDPKHHWLVTPFSMSPEHGYLDANGKMAFLSPAPTMDVAIMRELFPHCIEAGKLLGVDEDFRGKLEAALKRLPPYQINSRGFLQEWIEDWKPGDQGHNVSPNFTLYPGCSITLRGTPQLAGAIEKWMETRRGRGGWPTAWDISVWARLERGEKVDAWMQALIRSSLADNLHNRGANQSDASFGLTAGIAEALLQSHAGEISLLPALPPSWSDGSISGLRARGGFDVNMQWKAGKLQSAEIHNRNAATCKVRCGSKTAEFSVKAGETLRLNAELALAK